MGVRDGLNEEQIKAVEAADGPVLIVAGPGTGKTKTLVARIAYLIESGQAMPNQILALTFTKKAAEEMQHRLKLSGATQRPHILTFHALCHELLGDGGDFVTDAERLQLIKSLPRPKVLKDLSARELGLLISRSKNQPAIEDPDIAKVVRAYNKALGVQELRDFDDLLLGAYELLKEDAAARQRVQQRYRFVLVDEFQDTNLLQYEILKLLLGHRNLFVIGDPNQSIYGFRGANETVFERFRADFPERVEIALTVNYRSAPQIVHLSNALFPDAPDLLPHGQDAGLVRAVQVLNEYGEADWVLNEIQRAIGGGDMLKAVSDDSRLQHHRLSDFAVLYRSRPAALALQKRLAESGLPYQVVGDGSPYDQPQVQAIIALLRAGANHEPVKLEGYGSAELRHIQEALEKADEADPSALVERIIEVLGIEPSRDLQQLASVLVRFKDVPSALAHFDTIAERGFYDPTADAITLLTIHASKGLEFPQVFLIGAEEGVLPSARGDDAEEKRLFYVAATRARERLEITHARNRSGQKAEASRFVTQLPHDILKRHEDPDMEKQVRRIAKRAAKNSQTSLF
ncbi:MAG TPA: ATP-dependent helicase [Candidatus Pristimantibacillus sp.]|jgi:superfamily I DNA/RNA helicase|nr:ATP-dependent helicase [Candidatus Pristimantibacillus sp.]